MRPSLLLCVLHSLGFPDHIDLDLAGIFQLGLDLLGNISCQMDHIVLGNDLGLDHDTDLAASLDGECLFHAGVGAGEFLQLLQTADVIFHVLAAGTGTGSRYSISSLHQHSDDGLAFCGS